MKKRELKKVNNNNGSYHYELSKAIEVDIDKEFPKNSMREWFMKLLSKFIDINQP